MRVVNFDEWKRSLRIISLKKKREGKEKKSILWSDVASLKEDDDNNDSDDEDDDNNDDNDLFSSFRFWHFLLKTVNGVFRLTWSY